MAAALLGGPATASGIAPFGHPCTLQDNNVRLCPTSSNARRVHSFDGVPLDVDVTLPPTGHGPFPAVAMLHGFPGDKTSFELTTHGPVPPVLFHYNNVYYARQGYAVVTYSARGFGNSCGVKASRTSPGCDRGWFVNALYLGGVLVGYLAPKGADPTADLATWKERLFAGEPYGKAERSLVDQLTRFKSATGIPGNPAPLLIMDGWTDPAFSASEALRTYHRLDAGRTSYVALQLGDLGHFRA